MVGGVDDILRFPSAVRHDPAIDAWLGAQKDELRPLVTTWFAALRACGDSAARCCCCGHRPDTGNGRT
jgi:hypothetical protein